MTDRELDKLVAEKVIGNDVFSIGGPNPLQEGNKDRGTRILAHYSTSIEAAWEVVEKMKNLGCASTMINGIAKGYLHFEFYNAVKQRFHAQADTAPKAICLAALKAVGVEIE